MPSSTESGPGQPLKVAAGCFFPSYLYHLCRHGPLPPRVVPAQRASERPPRNLTRPEPPSRSVHPRCCFSIPSSAARIAGQDYRARSFGRRMQLFLSRQISRPILLKSAPACLSLSPAESGHADCRTVVFDVQATVVDGDQSGDSWWLLVGQVRTHVSLLFS
jgi:hypothetical protein